jgi:cysteine-rich repeat protein
MGRTAARSLQIVLAVASLTVMSSASAGVDVSGPWAVRNDVLGFDVGTFVQTGSSVSATIWGSGWVGTIDSASGAFALTGPPAPGAPGCGHMQLVAAVDPGGISFHGGVSLFFVGLSGECVFAGSAPTIGLRCGNGVLDPGEQCDDGNSTDGDCCSSACQFEPADAVCAGSNVCLHYICDGAGACIPAGPNDGQSCDDGLFCNGSDVCSGGTCVHLGDPCAGQDACHRCDEPTDQCLTPAGTRCGPCRACDDAGACVGTPIFFTCKSLGVSKLTISNRMPDTKDKLSWKLTKGADTAIADLGDPTADTGYALCAFDVSPAAFPYQLLFSTSVPAGSDWKISKNGFRYRRRSGTPDGVSSVTLVAGVDRKAKASVKGSGELLPLPATETPLPLPLVVQLQNDAGTCWGATFATAASNDGTTFKAKTN